MAQMIKIEDHGFLRMFRTLEKNHEFFSTNFKIHGMKSGLIGCYKKVCNDSFAIQKFKKICDENKGLRTYFFSFGSFEA
jgi:hypothetical protein